MSPEREGGNVASIIPEPSRSPSVEEAARTVETAIVAQLARSLAEHQREPASSRWWERPAVPILLAALVGGIGPVATVFGARQAREEERIKRVEARRMEYARTLMTAASPEKRLELLSLIASAPESDEIDRRWAAQEQTRVTNRMELADKKLAEAETEKKAAVEGAKRAQEEARNATNEVATQRRLREEAEAKAKSQNATIRAAAAREIQDLRDKEATARKAAQVAMEREAASVEREHRAQRDLARRETSVLAPSAPPPPGVPRSFIASAAERLLRGDKDAASQFVIWTETPQGSDFWIAQKERLQHGDALEPAAASAVRAWLQAYKKAEP